GAVSVDRPLEPTRQQLSTSLAGAMAGLRATMRAASENGSPSAALTPPSASTNGGGEGTNGKPAPPTNGGGIGVKGKDKSILLTAGLEVAIRPAADDDLNDTLFVGGLFTGGGLSAQQVLQMLTVNPAKMLGVADRVGSLSVGKDADFVVLTGEPFATHTRVQ